MSRRHRSNGPFVAKGRVAVAKAIDIGSADASIFSGTLADSHAQTMPDSEQYWAIFKKHPWVRACVRIIANAVAQEGYDIAPAQGDDPIDDKNPNVELIHDFFRVGFIGTANTFRKIIKATTIDVEIFGWAFWRKKYAGKDLAGIERLDPRLVHPVLNDDRTEIVQFILKKSAQNITGQVQNLANAMTAGNVTGESIPADEIIMFSLDEGGDTVLGAPSPLEALDLTIAMDLNVRQHRNSFFRNGAQTGNVFVNEDADEDQVRAAEKQLVAMKTGARNAFRHLILTGMWKPYALQKQGNNDLDFIKGSELVRDEIAAVYNVPVSKLINVSGSMGQAGKGEDDESFEQECVLPIEENLYETLTIELLQKEWGIEDLALVPKRRNKVHPERALTALNGVKTGWTGNESREYQGLARMDDPEMDKPMFLSATAGNLAGDEPSDPAQQPQSNQLDNAAQNAKNEVAQRAKARFRTTNTHAEADLSRRLHGLVDAETARLSTAWDEASTRIKALSDPNHFTVMQAIGDLRLVNRDAYVSAATAGMNALPARKASSNIIVSADDIANEWIAHVQPYADAVLDRTGQAILAELQADDTASALDDKLNALRSSITRYAEPVWGTGQQGYSAALDANDVLVVWELGADDDHCDDCLEIADGSPYARGDLPSYPKLGDTACRDRCYCSIVADPETFTAAFG